MDSTHHDKGTPGDASDNRPAFIIWGPVIALAGVYCGVKAVQGWLESVAEAGSEAVEQSGHSEIIWLLAACALIPIGCIMLIRGLPQGPVRLKGAFGEWFILAGVIACTGFGSMGMHASILEQREITELEVRGVRTTGVVRLETEDIGSSRNKHIVYREYVHFMVDGKEYTARGISHESIPYHPRRLQSVIYLPETPGINQTVDAPKSASHARVVCVLSGFLLLLPLLYIVNIIWDFAHHPRTFGARYTASISRTIKRMRKGKG